MSLVLEVSRKVNINDRDAQSVLARALKMGFTVRVAGTGGSVTVAPKGRFDSAASFGVAQAIGRGRRTKKKRGIYRIDDLMGKKMHEMRRDGLTIRAIARAFRLSTSGVGNYLKRAARGEALAS